MTTPQLVLASASSSRLRVLTMAGIVPVVVVSSVDEDEETAAILRAAGPGARVEPRMIAELLSQAKARDVAVALADRHELAESIVVGADSVLEWDGRDWGKPITPEAATQRWRLMRGTSGWLHTGHCVIGVGSRRELSEVATTKVSFADVSDAEIDAYVASGEPLNVAGAFTIEGLAGPFIESIEGDPSNVTGLSLPLLRRLFAQLGVTWTDLWHRETGRVTGGCRDPSSIIE